MPVDLTAIRALLASVGGFTPGPLLRSVAKGRCERIDELHAELDKRVAPHCQHAADPGHSIDHGVHPDRVGPSVLDAEIERLTAERDRRIDPVEHARAVRAAFLAGFDQAPGDYFAAPQWERDPLTQWSNADDRATLLARVGADALAEVEDG